MIRRAAWLPLLLAACGGTDPTPAPPAPVALARSEAWAGSTLGIRSADFNLGAFSGVLRRDGTGVWSNILDVLFQQFDGVDDAFLSPRGDRALYRATTVPGRHPVYDPERGEIAFDVPWFRQVLAADFSATDDVMAVAGHGPERNESFRQLLVLKASDGTVIADTAFGGTIGAVRFDPIRPLLYVAWDLGGLGAVTMLALPSYRVLGTMRGSKAVGYGVLLSVDHATLYHIADGYVQRFALPAGTGVFPP